MEVCRGARRGLHVMNSATAIRFASALALGLAMFVAVNICLAYLRIDRSIGFWLANGIVLAVLLRMPRDRWPLLLLCAFLGNLAATILFRPGNLSINLIFCLSNTAQYLFLAGVLRARFGPYFDLLQGRQLGWLCALSLPATALKCMVLWLGAILGAGPEVLPESMLSWFLSLIHI